MKLKANGETQWHERPVFSPLRRHEDACSRHQAAAPRRSAQNLVWQRRINHPNRGIVMVKHHSHGSIGHNKHGAIDSSHDNRPTAAEDDEAEPDAKRHRREVSSSAPDLISSLLIQPGVADLDLTGSKLSENDCLSLASVLATPSCHLTALNMRWAGGQPARLSNRSTQHIRAPD